MVAIGVSEFSFGFAFLHEQANRYFSNLRSVPILPSLRQETEEGWDARLPTRGIDYYFQFKLSDYMYNGNAKYIRESIYSGPYHRIKLHNRDSNKQHRRLFQLSQQKPYTYYVAPRVKTEADFNRAYLTSTIIPNSILIPVRYCGNIRDNHQHYITFQEGSRGWTLHSEPKSFKDEIRGEELWEQIQKNSLNWQKIDRAFAAKLHGEVRELALKTIEYMRSIYDPDLRKLLMVNIEENTLSSIFLQTAKIMSTFFGATLVIVGEGEQ